MAFQHGITKSTIPASSEGRPGTGQVELLAIVTPDDPAFHGPKFGGKAPKGEIVEVKNWTANEIEANATVKVSLGADGGRSVTPITL